MKKIIATFILGGSFLFVGAQNISVPQEVKTAFHNRYGNEQAEWSIAGRDFRATFNISGAEAYCYIDSEGNWVQTDIREGESNISSTTKESVNQRFTPNNYTLIGYYKSITPEKTLESVRLLSGSSVVIVYFDEEGKIVKRRVE